MKQQTIEEGAGINIILDKIGNKQWSIIFLKFL
jgi:hypothetical protein